MQEQFGISFVQIISYTVIFFLLYFFARKFVRQLLATTKQRQTIIEEGLQNAEKVEILRAETLKDADHEKKAIIQNAYTHANEIIEKAKQKESQILTEAHVKSKSLLSDAETELKELRNRSKEEGLTEAKEIISLAIHKAFSNLTIDKKTEEELIEESLKNI